MPNNTPALVVISILFATNAAAGSAHSHDSSDRCVERTDERTSAYVTRDWRRLEVLARQYISRCAGVVEIENVSDAYEDIATAEFELKHFDAALRASDRCLDKWYSNAGCHVLRLQSLLALNRPITARTELERSKKLISHGIERGTSGELTITDPVQQKKNEAMLDKLRALQELVVTIERNLLDGASPR